MRVRIKAFSGALVLLVIVMALGQACSNFNPNVEAKVSNQSSTTPTARTCVPPAGVSGSPKTIEEAVALINALPKPTSVACFLESLDRPLRVFLTDSTTSAQPAAAVSSPRVFIFSGELIISIVPEGMGGKVVEFSRLKSPNFSTKGELGFPVSEALPLSAPYDQIRHRSGTVCAVCHRNESRDAEISFAEAYVSTAFQPKPETKVELQWLRTQTASCDSASQPQRCEVLKALFDHGTVQEQSFPTSMPFFF